MLTVIVLLVTFIMPLLALYYMSHAFTENDNFFKGENIDFYNIPINKISIHEIQTKAANSVSEERRDVAVKQINAVMRSIAIYIVIGIAGIIFWILLLCNTISSIVNLGNADHSAFSVAVLIMGFYMLWIFYLSNFMRFIGLSKVEAVISKTLAAWMRFSEHAAEFMYKPTITAVHFVFLYFYIQLFQNILGAYFQPLIIQLFIFGVYYIVMAWPVSWVILKFKWFTKEKEDKEKEDKKKEAKKVRRDIRANVYIALLVFYIATLLTGNRSVTLDAITIMFLIDAYIDKIGI